MATLDAKKRNAIDDKQFAFPKQRKEPLENAAHVRNAVARFDQVKDVTDAERDTAWKHIKGSGEEVRRRGEGDIVARAGRRQGQARDVMQPGAGRRACVPGGPTRR